METSIFNQKNKAKDQNQQDDKVNSQHSLEFIDTSSIVIKRTFLTFGPATSSQFNQPQDQNASIFICDCNDKLQSFQKVNEHRKRCVKFSEKHHKIVDALDRLIEDARDQHDIMDAQVLNNVEAMFKGFDSRMKIKKVTMERMGSLSIDSEIEEEKIPLVPIKMVRAASIQRSNEFFEALPEEEMKCNKCNTGYKDSDFGVKIFFLDSCCHLLCTECLKGPIKVSYPDVKCPIKGCECKLANAEIRSILGDKDYEALQTDMTNKLLEEQEGIVRCKCGNAIEFVKGEVIYDYKDDGGKNINKISARHMSANRVRCPECGINFCVSCKVEPYHLGMNCQQYEKHKNAKKCRFCGGILKGIRQQCTKRECKMQAYQVCKEFLDCGHPCYGYGNETVHPPCLHEDCVAKAEQLTLGENSDSYCSICYVQGLGEKAVVQLGCRHIFHFDCLQRKIQQKWYQNNNGFGGGFVFGIAAAAPQNNDPNANAISLKHATCPSCNQFIDLPKSPHLQWIHQILDEAKDLEKQIKEKGVLRAKHEGLDLDERITDPKSEYFNNLEKFAIDHLNYYQCFTCKNAYFGGLRACGNNENVRRLEAEQNEALGGGFVVNNGFNMQCPKCKFFSQDQNNKFGVSYCDKHKETYIQYKCNFCCNIAAYHCGGTNYYCMHCHDRKGPPGHKCKGKDDCPLGVEHPPNGTQKAFAVGCGLCRELKIKGDEFENQIKEQQKKLEEMNKKYKDF